jgi:hypothetical protein
MIENLKYFSKLSLSGIVSLIKINTLGSISTIAVTIIGIINLSKDINVVSSGHVSAIPFITSTFASRPVGFILLCLSLFAFPVLIYMFANKYVLKKLANKIIIDKSETILNPMLDRLFDKFKANQPGSVKNAADYSINKLKLIENIKNDKTENKWLKRIIVFGLKKVKMDDVDFNKEDQNFYDILKIKTLETLHEISEPSKNIIWLTLGTQWLILGFICLTKF